MDRITLENYRCFREKQSARLAPLTLLVGNNSTGKTSFLALIRALWDVAFLDQIPDFREDPYDLGTFREIAHNRGGRGGKADSFEAGFIFRQQQLFRKKAKNTSFEAKFKERDASPFPETRVYSLEQVQLTAREAEDRSCVAHIVTPIHNLVHTFENRMPSREETWLVPFRRLVFDIRYSLRMDEQDKSKADEGSATSVNQLKKEEAVELESELSDFSRILSPGLGRHRPFASAPIRSRPRRTYDPSRPSRDPEGEYVPTYIASMFHRNKKEWDRLKDGLEEFGRESGLYDEIAIKSLGGTDGTPFQVQIRKSSAKRKGTRRNLIDVGYGVSQALPLLTELLRKDAPRMFLLQQPEVHLHPSAQAALGSLFCNIAGTKRQLIVETHSDYILNRVRMDIRDKKTDLKPEDVSILYFETGELDVTIHSLGLDKNGNVLDAPPGYRQFFMAEMRRSIGI